MGHELDDIDREIIDLLAEGRNTPANMASRLNRSRQYVHQRLSILVASDHVEKVDRGLYGLGPKFESEAEPGDLDGCADTVLRARKGIEDVLNAMDRNDGQAARRAAEDVQDVLNEVDV